MSLTTHIDMVGQAGMAYVRTGSGIQAVNVATPTAPVWSAPLEWTLLAAKPDGGAFARNEAGDLGDFSATGQLTGPTPIGLLDPVPQFESLVGNTPYGVRAIASNISDATRWDAVKRVVGYQRFEQWGYGDSAGNSQQRRPGIGVFTKVHRVDALGVLPFVHVSIRITPEKQTYWKSHPQWGAYFNSYLDKNGVTRMAVDEFGNASATLGGGPPTDDATQFCSSNSLLVGRPNRPSDQEIKPLWADSLFYHRDNPLVLGLPSRRDIQDMFIGRLFTADANYPDNLMYECFPDPDEYNSNSYAAGLIYHVGMTASPYIAVGRFLVPGWNQPVPSYKFEPQD